MTTRQLYEFLVLSKLLSFSKAAQTLYISQSILTRHVQSMEAELQVRLFDRSTHGARLTEAGRILAMEASGLIDLCEKAEEIVQMQNLPLRGHIRIGCELEISYAAHIRDFLAAFHNRYPDIELNIEVIPTNTPPELTGAYDLLFTPCDYPNLTPDVRRELIYSHGTYAVLPPEHKLMSQSLIALHQLSGETLVVPYADEIFGPYAQNMLLVEKSTSGRISTVKAPNLSTALLLVSLGKGICIAPRYVKNMVPPSTFVIGISDRSARFNEYIYFNSASENGAAKLFYEEFIEQYRRKP